MSGFENGLPSINVPNIEELYFGGDPVGPRLSSTSIGQIAAMTSLRSLELRLWKKWDDVKPMAALSLLTRLTCNQGLCLIADLLQPGCLQSLEVTSTTRTGL